MAVRKLFGTDGVRGKANQYPMTAEIALKLGIAAGSLFKKGEHRSRVVIGKDTRLSGYMIETALTSGFTAVGMDVLLLGPMPTPAVAMLTRSMRADLGVVISASHNPYEDNGIKFFGPDGYKLSDETELEIESRVLGDVCEYLAPSSQIGQAKRLDDAIGRYIEYVKQTFPRGKMLEGLKVVLDCANGAASSVARPVFDAMGAETHVINNAPNGFNINVDCGSTHIQRLQDFVVRNGLDVGFAYDGDADRCLAVDERGRVVDGDLILYVCGTYMAKHGRLAKNTVVPTVMSNFGFFKALDAAGLSYEKTAVGDKNVWACMMENGYTLGGEQSGHIIFGDLEKTGDGIMTSLRIMEVLRAEREKLSELTRPVTLYPQQLVNVRVADKDAAMAAPEVKEAVAEAEKFLEGNGRVLVRASGTEPLVRVLAEAPEEGLCQEANAIVLKALEPFKE